MTEKIRTILISSLTVLAMDNISPPVAVAISLGIGVIIAAIVQIFVVPAQRRAVTDAKKSGKPVKFTINDSTESTPSGSPKRNKRPASLTGDGKALPAITETTELVSFNNLSGVSPSLYTDHHNTGKRMDFVDVSKCNGTAANGKYKIDPKVIEKAENLLGKASLDNIDLTVTSLNYIDEHHVAHHPNSNNGRSVQGYFDRNHVITPDAIKM